MDYIGGVGWFGEFGANPSLPPPLGTLEVDVNLVQPNTNPVMQSASILINQATEQHIRV